MEAGHRDDEMIRHAGKLLARNTPFDKALKLQQLRWLECEQPARNWYPWETAAEKLYRLYQVYSVEEAAAGFAPPASPPTAPEPKPLRPTKGVPDFPVSALPPVYRDLVLEVARSTQTAPDVAGTLLLGVLAACCAGRAEVVVRGGYTEPLCLYTVVASASGTRKSAVYSILTGPVYAAEAELEAQVAPLLRDALGRKEIAEQRAANLRRQAAKALRGSEEAHTLEQDATAAAGDAAMINVPVVPGIIHDDVTPEAATTLLAKLGRLGICSDEGGIFGSFGRYTKGDPNIEWVLKGHAGSPMKVHRKGKIDEPEVIR